MKCKKDDGFTFVETIVCMAIVLILTLAVGLSSVQYIDKARETTVWREIDIFKKALDAYYADTGAYPTQNQGLDALWKKPVLFPVPKNWNGPYIDNKVPSDPWGYCFVYRVPGNNKLPYEIICYGSDGEKGGNGTARDYVSWDR